MKRVLLFHKTSAYGTGLCGLSGLSTKADTGLEELQKMKRDELLSVNSNKSEANCVASRAYSSNSVDREEWTSNLLTKRRYRCYMAYSCVFDSSCSDVDTRHLSLLFFRLLSM